MSREIITLFDKLYIGEEALGVPSLQDQHGRYIQKVESIHFDATSCGRPKITLTFVGVGFSYEPWREPAKGIPMVPGKKAAP